VEATAEAAHPDGGRHLQPVLASGDAAVWLPSARSREVLEQVCGEMGYPASIRVDQGNLLISRDLDLWAYTSGVMLDFS